MIIPVFGYFDLNSYGMGTDDRHVKMMSYVSG
jgi:hypothetical protein